MMVGVYFMRADTLKTFIYEAHFGVNKTYNQNRPFYLTSFQAIFVLSTFTRRFQSVKTKS